jgi:electron transport complex protein RnfE
VKSFCDGFGMGCGFTLAMLLISVIRELIGAGTILGMPVLGESYNPMLMMVLPPGAFILIGYLVAAFKTWNSNQEKKAQLAELKAKKEAEA